MARDRSTGGPLMTDPLSGIEVQVIYGTGDDLVDALPTLSPVARERLVEIASRETAIVIGREFSRHIAYTNQQLLAKAGDRARKRFKRARAAIHELRSLRLHPWDFHEWGLGAHAGEALKLKAAADSLAELFDSSPLLNGKRGQPRKHAKNALALRIYRHLDAAGVDESLKGPLSEVLDLLLGIDGGDHSRQLKYVRANL